jgi:tripartite-type tricarboxylate transporter receptor subunit TctC
LTGFLFAEPEIAAKRRGTSAAMVVAFVIATEAVVNAPPDGYTLLLANLANAINATLYEKLNFNFIRDIAPVAGISSAPLIMAVNPSVPRTKNEHS